MLEIIVTSSLLILIIIAMRYILRGKLSQNMIYALWIIAAVRLLVPISLADTPVSVMNLFMRPASTVQQSAAQEQPSAAPQPNINNINDNINYTPSPQQTEIIQPDNAPQPQVNDVTSVDSMPKMQAEDILLLIWGAGAAAVLTYVIVSNAKFYFYLKKNRMPFACGKSPVPVYVVKGLESPCLFGIVRPAIYLNGFAINDKQRVKYILVHEQTHYRHFDHIWAVVRVLCISLYWFNPLVWIAAHLSRQDCELACDSAALKVIGSEHRFEYGRTLVDMISTKFSFSSSALTSTAMSAGAKAIKKRILMLKMTHKNALWATAAAAIVLLAAIGCTFTGAVSPTDADTLREGVSQSDIIPQFDEIDEETANTFPYILSQYTTYYPPELAERTRNLTLAASYINGTIIQPGEEFSFNDTVGERTAERGFVAAQTYAAEAMDDYTCGGGVGQTATTLYNAAFRANLDITERFAHAFTVPYLNDAEGNPFFGRDASVKWGEKDLRFVNNREVPILIGAYCDAESITVSIYSVENGLDIRREMECGESDIFDCKTVFKPVETYEMIVNGQAGGQSVIYGVTYQGEAEIGREICSIDYYNPINRIIYTYNPPDGFEYNTEYSNEEAAPYMELYSEYPISEFTTISQETASENPLYGMKASEVWRQSEIKHLTSGVPVPKNMTLREAIYYKGGEVAAYRGEYNMQGTIPSRDLLVLSVELTNEQRADYISKLKKAGFTYTADDGSGDTENACLLYNAPQYGLGIAIDSPTTDRKNEPYVAMIMIFVQQDGCYGYVENIPKG